MLLDERAAGLRDVEPEGEEEGELAGIGNQAGGPAQPELLGGGLQGEEARDGDPVGEPRLELFGGGGGLEGVEAGERREVDEEDVEDGGAGGCGVDGGREEPAGGDGEEREEEVRERLGGAPRVLAELVLCVCLVWFLVGCKRHGVESDLQPCMG